MFNISISSAFAFLGLAIGWIVALFILTLEILILQFIWVGTNSRPKYDKERKEWYKPKGINLEKVISDEKGDASLARFQFLIFTFIISMSLVLIIVSRPDGPAFPTKIPPEILGLLGISSASYVLAKGIQAGRDVNLQENNLAESPDGLNKIPPPNQAGATVSPASTESQPRVDIFVHPPSAQITAVATNQTPSPEPTDPNDTHETSESEGTVSKA